VHKKHPLTTLTLPLPYIAHNDLLHLPYLAHSFPSSMKKKLNKKKTEACESQWDGGGSCISPY